MAKRSNRKLLPATEKRLAEGRALLARWKDDPVRFALEALRVKQVWERQAEVLEVLASMAAANEGRSFPGMVDVGRLRKISVRSGQKTGKSTLAAIAALWWFCTRLRARVILTSSSARQVRTVLWKEIKRLHRYDAKEAKRLEGRGPAWPLGGDPAKDPDTGLQLDDGREIVGFSTDEPEKMAGISGPALLFLVDEASGIARPILEAVVGNTAGGALIVLLSNPTKTSGLFFDSHQSLHGYHRIVISSEEAAAVTPRIPGLARPEFIEEMREEYGEDSAFYQVRVLGNFPLQGDDTVIPFHLVGEAEERWSNRRGTPKERLEIGVDPARFGNDESAIACRRGLHAYPIETMSGLDEAAVALRVVATARRHRRDGEVPIVRVDGVGLGLGVAAILRAGTWTDSVGLAHEWHDEIDVVIVLVTDRAPSPKFKALRDQLWFALRDWLREGGEIPKDPRLAAELVAPTFSSDPQGRIVVSSKDEIRKEISRSPDRADALALSVYVGSDSIAEIILADRTSMGRSRFAEEHAPRTTRFAEDEDDREDEDRRAGF